MATTTTTTTTMPRTPRAFNASKPPTSALPALPTNNSLSLKPSLPSLRRTSLLPSTNSPAGRSLSGSYARPQSTQPIPRSGILTPSSTEPKRAASIATSSFPQPPKNGANRVASLPPPSPHGFPKTPSNGNGYASSPLASPTRTNPHKDSFRPKTMSSSGNLSAKFSRDSMRDSGVGFLSGASTTSGGGEYTTSPPRSRTSSVQDSYSTNPTTADATSPRESGDDAPRGRTEERSNGGEKEMKGNVIISVRVRPDGPEDQMSSDWTVDARYGQVGYRGKDGGMYEYDNVFSQSDNNARVYESCAKRLVRRVMEGYHGTVFAYGMTGTGKTYSMQGTTSSPGVIPLAITDIFSFIRETPHREFLLRVSYLEIYNERIHDLLASQPGTTGFVPLDQQTKGEEIKLREDPKRGVYATPLKEEIVQSPTQLLRVIARGDLCRRTGSTQFNARSSRSHAVVQIVVESRDRIAGAGNMADSRRGGMNGGVRVSTLSLIDLAGSERAAENKERRTEGSHINRSLLTLGTVIARLSKDGEKDKDGSHLPYRDSKLTRLLQPALSGNSLISILCTIAIPLGNTSGAANLTNIGETMNTLKFAARAKNNIISHAKKGDDFLNGVDAGSKALLERYRAEIGELRRELEMQKRKDEGEAAKELALELALESAKERGFREEDRERHSEQMLEMQLARTALKERIEHLNRLILCSKSSGVNSARSSMHAPPNGHMSSLSMRSSSAPHVDVNPRLSTSSSVINPSDDDDSAGGDFNDGNASLAAQVRALQADLGDKNRYIATLEKRLLHARRSSQSRTSFGIGGSPHRVVYAGGEVVAEGRVEVLLREKDDEIAELRARLDDKERMVSALRSAARKRDVAEVCIKRGSMGGSDEGGGKRGSTRSSGGLSLKKMQEEVRGKDGELMECF